MSVTSAPGPAPRALLLNGTVGVGKTTTAHWLGLLLQAEGLPGAVVDLDALRYVWPAPADDRFQGRLVLHNLTAVCRNDVAAGAAFLVLAGVVETQAERDSYQKALDMPLSVCRLRADLPVVRARLRRRHADDPAEQLQWHLDRSAELSEVLERTALEDFVVAATAPSPQVAGQIMQRWLG